MLIIYTIYIYSSCNIQRCKTRERKKKKKHYHFPACHVFCNDFCKKSTVVVSKHVCCCVLHTELVSPGRVRKRSSFWKRETRLTSLRSSCERWWAVSTGPRGMKFTTRSWPYPYCWCTACMTSLYQLMRISGWQRFVHIRSIFIVLRLFLVRALAASHNSHTSTVHEMHDFCWWFQQLRACPGHDSTQKQKKEM